MEFKAQESAIKKVSRQLIDDLLRDERVFLVMGNHLTLIAMSSLSSFSSVLVGSFTTEMEALNAFSERKPTLLLATEGLEAGYGMSLVSKVKVISPDTRCLLFLERTNPSVIEEAIGVGADAVVRVESMCNGSGDFISSVMALAKGSVYFPEYVRDVLNQNTGKSEKLQMLSELTEREKDTLLLLCQAKSNSEIASELVLSLPTVKSFVSSIIAKMGVPSRTAAVVKAIKFGLVSLE